MITDFANHIWQSTIFAAAIAVLAFVVRRNHARVRYRLWCAASVKFLIPFAFLAALGSRVLQSWPWPISPRSSRWAAPRRQPNR